MILLRKQLLTWSRFTEYIDAGKPCSSSADKVIWTDNVIEHSAQGVRCFAFHPGGVGSTSMGQAAPEWLKPYLIDTSTPLDFGLMLLPSLQILTCSSRPCCRNLPIPFNGKGRLPKGSVRQLELELGRTGEKEGDYPGKGPPEDTSGLAVKHMGSIKQSS